MSMFHPPSRSGPRRWAGEVGLTLVDTIVALGLLLLCTATIGGFLVQQIHTGGVNVSYSTAYALAAEELEELRGLDYADIASRSRSVAEGALTYTVATVVRTDTPERNMKQITVDVTWNDPGISQHVTVETIYTAVRR
jgi:hypothetical protein